MASNTAKFSPGKDQIRGLLKMPDNKPIVMINLLKFKEKTEDGESGRKAYLRYMKNVAPYAEQVGAELIWAGKTWQVMVSDTDEEWDQIIIIKYPSPRAFLKMVMNENYKKAHCDREKALERTSLIANTEYQSMLSRI